MILEFPNILDKKGQRMRGQGVCKWDRVEHLREDGTLDESYKDVATNTIQVTEGSIKYLFYV